MGKKADNIDIKKKGNKKPPQSIENANDTTTTTSATAVSSNKCGGGKKPIITDARFSSVHSDPRFQKPQKHQSKVAIDSRFNRIFDKDFSSSKTRLDKRGKPKNPNSENPLLRYYKLDKEAEAEDEVDEPKKKKKHQQQKKNRRNRIEEKVSEDEDDSSSSSGSDDDEDEEPKKKQQQHQKKKDRRNQIDEQESEEDSESEPNNEDEERLKLVDQTESDDTDTDTSSAGSETNTDTSSTDSDSDEDGVLYEEEETTEPEEKIDTIEQETHRLAIVNLDWSQIRAVDLFVLMSSFLPKGGQILSVSVYPSEFGLKRMEEEAVKGPVDLFDNEEGKDDDDDDEIDDEKLRAYEKSRLRYYYAVVECDSSATAYYLYKSCDGTELERTSNVLDLRFIPDSMEFKHHPRDVAKEVPANYQALDFHTQSLQLSKIHLSWEEDEPQRAKMLKHTFKPEQLDELEFKEFLASDGGDSDDDDVNNQSGMKLDKREKYAALLQSGDGSDENGSEVDKDMEITFNTGLEDISKRILEKKKNKESESVWEAYLRKKKEKKARKNRSKNSSEDESNDSGLEASEEPDDFFVEEPSVKSSKLGKSSRRKQQEQEADKEAEASRAELELLFADDEWADGHLKGYNLKPKKAKGKKGKEVANEDKLPAVDYDDPRFSALFNSPQYALDPTDPQYKRSAAYARQLARKQHSDVRGESTNGEQMKLPTQVSLKTDDTIAKRDDQLQCDNGVSNKEKYELSSLVRSIKKKAQQVHVPSSDRPSKRDRLLEPESLPTKKEKHELQSLVRSVKSKTRNAEEPYTDIAKKDATSVSLTKKRRKN